MEDEEHDRRRHNPHRRRISFELIEMTGKPVGPHGVSGELACTRKGLSRFPSCHPLSGNTCKPRWGEVKSTVREVNGSARSVTRSTSTEGRENGVTGRLVTELFDVDCKRACLAP